MEQRVSPTRMELLRRKTQIALAEQGEELLREKRNALAKEFMTIVGIVVEASERLERVATEASQALAMAEAIDGVEATRSASFVATRGIDIQVTSESIMGVRVPRIEGQDLSRSVLERGYSLSGTSSRIDLVAERFEEEVELIIELAAREMRLRRLAEEIQETTRRVNALENILIPRLETQLKYIQMVLDEREREDIFRLKHIKRVLTRKKA